MGHSLSVRCQCGSVSAEVYAYVCVCLSVCVCLRVNLCVGMWLVHSSSSRGCEVHTSGEKEEFAGDCVRFEYERLDPFACVILVPEQSTKSRH